MFGSLGAPELILIFIVALIVFGPRRLPEIGRTIGGIVRDLRRATGDFRTSVEREIGLDASPGGDEARRVRRDLLGAVSEPFRDAAEGAMGAVRDVREAVILPPGPAAGGAPPAGSIPGPGPLRVAPAQPDPPSSSATPAQPAAPAAAPPGAGSPAASAGTPVASPEPTAPTLDHDSTPRGEPNE